jgi:CRISPR-associated protein Cmr5
MSNTDRYIPLAFDAIRKVKLAGKKDGRDVKYGFVVENNIIPKVYKGYVSSFGANIIQAGIKTAVHFYEAKAGSSEGDKRLITAAIRYMLNKDEQHVEEFGKYKLSEKLESDAHKLQNQTLQIMDAATALKLALRTYTMK